MANFLDANDYWRDIIWQRTLFESLLLAENPFGMLLFGKNICGKLFYLLGQNPMWYKSSGIIRKFNHFKTKCPTLQNVPRYSSTKSKFQICLVFQSSLTICDFDSANPVCNLYFTLFLMIFSIFYIYSPLNLMTLSVLLGPRFTAWFFDGTFAKCGWTNKSGHFDAA